MADPRVLILDEATSNMDAHTEALIQEAMAEIRRGRTTVIVAHRFATVRQADRIVVLERGRVVDQGTHEDMLRECEASAGCTRSSGRVHRSTPRAVGGL